MFIAPSIRRGIRGGFTLVELLVVMAIMAVLASIGLYAFQPFSTRSAVNNGGLLLQSWITAARVKAMRNGAPSGIRFLPGDEVLDSSGSPRTELCTKMVYIDSAAEFRGTGITVSGSTATIQDQPSALTLSSSDYLEINGGLVRQISSASADTSTSPPKNTITLKQSFPYSISSSSSGVPYRIFRDPGANLILSGDDILRLPRGSAVNFNGNQKYPSSPTLGTDAFKLNPKQPSAGTPFDIVFAPDGTVPAPPNSGRICLWVSGTQADSSGTVNPRQGHPALVVVYPQSGVIGSYEAVDAPASPPDNDPYKNIP